MQSRGARIGVVVVAAAVVVVLFFVLRDSDDESTPTTSVAEQTTTSTEDEPAGSVVDPNEEPKPEAPEVNSAEIEVEGGQPVGGLQEIEFPAGEKAELVVTTSDTTEEVHFHGYDLTGELAPDKPVKIEFTADIEGVFEVELEQSVVPIAEVTVK